MDTESNARTPAPSAQPEARSEARSDAALLAAHVAGDHDAFGELFGRHRDRLWAVALRTTGHPETAADGLQEGMIAAFRRADSFRGDAQVSTWLHRVVVNACLDRLRAEKVRRADPLPDDLDAAERGAGAVHDHAADRAEARDPAEHQIQAEHRAAVLDALRELPVDQRAAVVLVDMEGMSVAEAAEILDCPTGTVKSRCSRGRARLAVRLAGMLDDGPGETGPSETAITASHRNQAGAPDVGSGSRRGPPEAPENNAPTNDPT